MSSHTDRLLARIVEGCELFLQGKLKLTQVQCLVASTESALEGPVESGLMDYLEGFDATVEDIRFMNPEHKQPDLAKVAVEQLVATVASYRETSGAVLTHLKEDTC